MGLLCGLGTPWDPSPLLKAKATLDLLHYWKWTTHPSVLLPSAAAAAAAATLTIVFVSVRALPAGVRRNAINLHTDERIQSFASAGAW